ncbi:hypothetical protein HYH02_014179 [Chlamydomonas schloesseri]|uniref:Uncharacterized protein n=1 Tax=Chlamydomonas schloesseri TaxID=2026947 RepID=A0A835SL89_9CHLO|nr:hypothetical protein HYH02_014179 [Chlamydomonas schloesseri]|eukprot:KAG2429143.1 hypothetical protein HYH02_014179 [Chlamydomonas schloesseri]
MAGPYLKPFNLSVGASGVIEHAGATTAGDVTDGVVASVALASHKAQAVNAMSSGSVPDAAVAQLERNKQLVVSGGGAQSVTRRDLDELRAGIRAGIRADIRADISADIDAAVSGLFQQMSAYNHNQNARLQNSQAGDSKQYQALVREKPGSVGLGAAPPAVFPKTKDDLTTITNDNITGLAQHYGEEFAACATVVERRRALARFMGVQW